MKQVTVISVGTLKEEFLREAAAEYEKRLSAFCRIENVNLKEERIANEDNAAEIAAALDAEGEKMLARVPQGAYTVALCVEGKEPDSPALAAELGRAFDSCGKVCFFIGSSHGLSPAVKAAADLVTVSNEEHAIAKTVEDIENGRILSFS